MSGALFHFCPEVELLPPALSELPDGDRIVCTPRVPTPDLGQEAEDSVYCVPVRRRERETIMRVRYVRLTGVSRT